MTTHAIVPAVPPWLYARLARFLQLSDRHAGVRWHKRTLPATPADLPIALPSTIPLPANESRGASEHLPIPDRFYKAKRKNPTTPFGQLVNDWPPSVWGPQPPACPHTWA